MCHFLFFIIYIYWSVTCINGQIKTSHNATSLQHSAETQKPNQNANISIPTWASYKFSECRKALQVKLSTKDLYTYKMGTNIK